MVKDENFTNAIFSIGLSGLFDESFNKALKSQYISASVSYYQYLDVQHRFKFGLAPQVSYISRFLDYNKLTFASQYNGNDFDTSLPNYLDLQNDKISYFDLNVGANFSATFERFSLVLGYARYHLTRATETFLGTSITETLPRKTVNFGVLYLPNNYVDLNFSTVYQQQGKINDTLGGFLIGFKPNEVTKLKVNAGLWYKFNESSYYPYLGVAFGNISAGINYTVYANRILNATPRTYEISLIYQHNNFKGFKVPCPKF